ALDCEVGHQLPSGGVILTCRGGCLAEQDLQADNAIGQIVKRNVTEDEEGRDQQDRCQSVQRAGIAPKPPHRPPARRWLALSLAVIAPRRNRGPEPADCAPLRPSL